jgi:hypothetical protein
MAKIISTKKLKYDGRNTSKEAIVQLEVIGFKYLMNEKYLVIIRDSIVVKEIVSIPPVDIPQEVPGDAVPPIENYREEIIITPIGLREKIYSKENIDSLFTLSQDTIGPEDSFTEKFEDVIEKSLLAITKMAPIYGSVAEDWEIVNKG